MSFSLFDNLSSGNPLQLLSLPGFDAAAHLLPLGRIVSYLIRLVGSSPDREDLGLIPREHLAFLARRLLLGRHPRVLADLGLLWQANGSPAEVVLKAADAASLALEAWPADGPLRFSPAHADFVDRLGELEQGDRKGPIGRAIRLSRYQGAAGNGPFLPGEELHVGFPVVLSGESSALTPAVWVTPSPYQSDQPGPGSAAELEREWGRLHQLPLPQVRPMDLPEWIAGYVERYGLAQLASAGLAVLLQALAEAEERPLPAGVGFTGRVDFGARSRLEDVRIRPVRGLTAKLQAAREAGAFVLFACPDPEEILPSEPVPGVRLVCLEEGRLPEVLTAINTACAELGLTEYRRRRAVSRMRERLPAAEQRRGIASPLLPDATRGESCPVGVVERPGALDKLRRAWNPVRGRSFVFLVGDARCGKTTLLGDWLQHLPGRPPAWFSLQRGTLGTGEVAALQEGVREQLDAQCLVLAPNLGSQSRRPAPADDPYGLLSRLAPRTRARLDVVIDGLDEISEPRRREVLDFLRSLPGKGLCLVGTQPSIPAGYEQLGSRVDLLPDSELAVQIIDRFARKFLKREGLREFGLLLQTRGWREGLARHAGGNPWVVTDFLRTVSEERAGWPPTPADARLTPDVRVYCREVLSDLLASLEVAASADELSMLVRCLALLEDRRWPLVDLLLLLDRPVGAEGLVRCRHLLLSRAAGRLLDVSANGEEVRFRDATFQEFLRQGNDDLQRIMAGRIADLLGDAPLPAAAGPSLREDMARLAADHVCRAANGALARRLLLETDWAALRLKTLADRGLSLTPLLRELRQLLALVRDVTAEERDAVADLDLCLATWQGAIEQSGLGAAWWPFLAEAQAWPVWRRQKVAVDSSRPRLLAPAPIECEDRPGYRIPSRIVESLGGPACELPAEAPGGIGSLVLATETGRLLELKYQAADMRYGVPQPFFLGLKTIREVGPLGPGRVLVFGQDPEDAPCVLEVDLAGRDVRPWGPGREAAGLVACAVLERSEAGEESLVLLGWQQGQDSRLSVWRNGMELASTELPFKGRWWLLGLTACTWAVWGNERMGEGEDERLRFCMQAFRGGQVSEITDRAMSDLIGGPIDGVVAGPEGQVALFCLDGDDAGVLVFRGDGQMPADPAMVRGVEDAAITEEGEYQAGDYLDAVPVVWHDNLGLVLRHDCSGFFTFRPCPEALPRVYPTSWQPFAYYEISARGGHRLSDGRVLLLFHNYGVVIGADGQTVTPVGKNSLEEESDAIFPDGSVVVKERHLSESLTLVFGSPLRGHVTVSQGKPNPHIHSVFARIRPSLWAAVPHEERAGSDGTRFRIEPEDLTIFEGDGKTTVGLKAVYQDLKSGELSGGAGRARRQPWSVIVAVRPMLLDLRKGPPGEWILRAGYIDQNAQPVLRYRDYRLSAKGQESVPEGDFHEVVLRDETVTARTAVTACTAVDRDRVAIADPSGRIEVVCLREERVTAVGFTLSSPYGLAVSRSPAGTYLVVVSDGVCWFKLEGPS